MGCLDGVAQEAVRSMSQESVLRIRCLYSPDIFNLRLSKGSVDRKQKKKKRWGLGRGSSVGKVLGEPEVKSQNPHKSRPVWWCIFGISKPWRQRQVDPWDLLGSQPA